MFNSKKFEKFTQYLNKSIPKTIHDLTYDIEKRIKTILQEQLNYTDFIKRNEFNLQAEHLSKIQKKIEQLEKRIKTIESICNNINQKSNDQTPKK